MPDSPGIAYLCLPVAVGGFLGTVARYAVGLVVDDLDGWPVATLVVNVVGAFALGVLLERLATRAAESSRRRDLRLFAGTGFLGSFTTYSSFAVEAERLIASGASMTALGYLLASLGCGLAACIAGVAVASRGGGRRPAGDRVGRPR